jgi:hypothetical protein
VQNTVVGDPYADHQIVTIAEARIRSFAGSDVNRAAARLLLGLYQHAKDLSEVERQAVLLRFPVEATAPVPGHVDGHVIGRRFARRSIGGVQ